LGFWSTLRYLNIKLGDGMVESMVESLIKRSWTVTIVLKWLPTA
jgi:hypothetical protein